MDGQLVNPIYGRLNTTVLQSSGTQHDEIGSSAKNQ